MRSNWIVKELDAGAVFFACRRSLLLLLSRAAGDAVPPHQPGEPLMCVRTRVSIADETVPDGMT